MKETAEFKFDVACAKKKKGKKGKKCRVGISEMQIKEIKGRVNRKRLAN